MIIIVIMFSLTTSLIKWRLTKYHLVQLKESLAVHMGTACIFFKLNNALKVEIFNNFPLKNKSTNKSRTLNGHR